MSGSVQFHGKESVMQAFENSDCQAWSFWQRTQLLTKGTGSDALEKFIDLIADSATNAIYTVKVYENINDAKEIKSNTPFDGSFNFRLDEPGMTVQGWKQTNAGNMQKLLVEVESLKQQLAERDEEPEEKTISGTIGDVIIEAIQDPVKLAVWVDLIKNIFTPAKPADSSPAPLRTLPYNADKPAPAAVGNINKTMKPLTEEEMQRIATAIDVLEKNDDKIVEHLEKLALMAERKPAQLKSILAILDTMQIT